MCKSNYFRKLMVKADVASDIVTVFSGLQSWNYEGITNADVTNYYVLTNENENARVLFGCDGSTFTMSTSVLPIEMDGRETTVYRYGYDFSDNQERDIRNDILFDLCKEIRNSANTNDIALYCGIVPAIND